MSYNRRVLPRRACCAALVLGFLFFGLLGCGGDPPETEIGSGKESSIKLAKEVAGSDVNISKDAGGGQKNADTSADSSEGQIISFQRPIAVMVDNAPAARPQSGLSKADVVVEALAEGGVPRFMAVFTGGSPDTAVGPIRSARPYFIHMAEEVGASYVHCGGSPEALSMLAKGAGVQNIDEFKAASRFFRDKSRRAPHNLYSNLSQLSQVSEKDVADLPVSADFAFRQASGASDGDSGTWEPCAEASIRFHSGHTVTYKYDRKTQTYMRFTGSEPDVDRVTGNQIRVRNIVVQEVEAKAVDDAGRLDMKLIGEGSGCAFALGKSTPMRWRKGNGTSQTEYLIGGRNLELTPGNTWIEIIPKGAPVTRKG